MQFSSKKRVTPRSKIELGLKILGVSVCTLGVVIGVNSMAFKGNRLKESGILILGGTALSVLSYHIFKNKTKDKLELHLSNKTIDRTESSINTTLLANKDELTRKYLMKI